MQKVYYFTFFLLNVVPVYGAAQVGFNKSGYISATVDTSQSYLGIALDSQNRIVIAGRTQQIPDEDLNALLVRYHSNGTLDTTFNAGSVNGGPGYVNRTGTMRSWGYYGLAINSQGKIIAVGKAKNPLNDDVGLIACYKSNGTLDADFNAGSIDGEPGFINDRQIVATNSSVYYAVTLDSQDRIIAVGQDDGNDGLIVRYNSNGTHQQTFDQDNTDSAVYYAVTIDSQGRIIAVGSTTTEDGLIVRYNADGSLDTTFNPRSINGGLGYINTEGAINSLAYYGVTLDNQGRIIVVGSTDDTDLTLIENFNGIVARYSSNGELDTTFNAFGIYGGPGYINSEDPTNSWSFYAVAVDPNNKIVVIGATNGASPYDLVMRLNEDGTFDTSFNGTGYNTTEDAVDCYEYYALNIDQHGKLLVSGRSNGGNTSHGIIARYLTNGKIDSETNWNSKNYREMAKINHTPLGMLSIGS